MSRRFVTDPRQLAAEPASARPRCPACGIRLNTAAPCCSRVCDDSRHAAWRRDMERATGEPS